MEEEEGDCERGSGRIKGARGQGWDGVEAKEIGGGRSWGVLEPSRGTRFGFGWNLIWAAICGAKAILFVPSERDPTLLVFLSQTDGTTGQWSCLTRWLLG